MHQTYVVKNYCKEDKHPADLDLDVTTEELRWLALRLEKFDLWDNILPAFQRKRPIPPALISEPIEPNFRSLAYPITYLGESFPGQPLAELSHIRLERNETSKDFRLELSTVIGLYLQRMGSHRVAPAVIYEIVGKENKDLSTIISSSLGAGIYYVDTEQQALGFTCPVAKGWFERFRTPRIKFDLYHPFNAVLEYMAGISCNQIIGGNVKLGVPLPEIPNLWPYTNEVIQGEV